MELQHLLVEAAELPPGGPDLEYDPRFLALEEEVRGKPEQEMGGTVIPAVEPDWPKVLEQAQSLLVLSKDLRIALHLVRALTHIESLSGFVAGIGLVNGLLERYWVDIHPRLDAEDNNDPTVRLNALAPLEPPKGAGAVETLLRDLRETAVVPPTPQGKVTVRDLLIADGKLSGAVGGQSAAAIDAILREAVDKDPAAAALPDQAIAAAQRLRTLVAERVGGELAPDVSAIVDMLKPAVQRMARLMGLGDQSIGETGMAAGRGSFGGEIRGRDDVNRAIDAICAFMERTEPANPAPLLLRRAQRLLNKSFVELIADLAPDSVGQVRLIAGLKDESGQ
jgi:type VI secretion system protein ImpA